MRETISGVPESGQPARVQVGLGERAYDILVGRGLMASCGHWLAPVLRRKHVAIVSDENVAGHYLPTLQAALEDAQISTDVLTLPPGETSKNFDVLESLCNRLLASGIERGDCIVALGGGVIGDLTGFAASIVRRGTGFVQMPTTLLAQVDSSVGGKTGINTVHGKNLIGAFHQPRLVLADTQTLQTLPRREFLAGYAEIVKYGLINDAGFFGWLEKNAEEVIARDTGARIHAITHSCQAKADIVARDERESGVRALLNLGHTFGHALEAACAYDTNRLVHGEGVAVGLCLAFELSTHLGLCPPRDTLRVRRHLQSVGLPADPGDIPGSLPDARGLVELMGQDKKVVNGKIVFILARGIGKGFVSHDVEPDVLLHFLSQKEAA